MPPVTIGQLLQDSRLWHAGRASAAAAREVIATGWPALDRALGGGWPRGQLTELLIDTHGVGELSLLLPALARLSSRRDEEGDAPGWVMFVAPPHVPYAPALACAGLNLSRLLVVHSRRAMETLWAIEQAVRSGTCSAVTGWSAVLREGSLRRLQLAAESGNCWTVLVRPARLQAVRSPAPLRILLQREGGTRRLLLSILKRRGGPPATVAVDIG
jgi:hypothetical protein